MVVHSTMAFFIFDKATIGYFRLCLLTPLSYRGIFILNSR